MKRIYFAENAVLAHHVKSLLLDAGIAAEVTGEGHSAGVGMGTTDLSLKPAVWVGKPEDYERALEIVRQYEQAAPADRAEQASWQCTKCSETVEGNFAICWNCGAERPGLEGEAEDGAAAE